MSMRDYSVDIWGIVLNGVLDNEKLMGLAESDVISYTGAFTGDAMEVNDNASPMWSKSESFSDDTIYYIELPKWPMMFKAAYKDMDELVTDMKKRYDEAVRESCGELPEMTRKLIRGNLRYVCGTYYG